MYRALLYIIVMIALMFPFTAAASELVDTAKDVIQYVLPFTRPNTVPDAAEEIADEIDVQIERYVGKEGFNRSRILLAVTVPVHLSNFEESNPLARQMAEEMGTALAHLGYSFVEIRKAHTIQMSRPTGETILTRDVAKLAKESAGAMGILTGTYVISKDNVRFTIKILQATNNKVLGMSSATVPITADIAGMLLDNRGEPKPSVRVQLP